MRGLISKLLTAPALDLSRGNGIWADMAAFCPPLSSSESHSCPPSKPSAFSAQPKSRRLHFELEACLGWGWGGPPPHSEFREGQGSAGLSTRGDKTIFPWVLGDEKHLKGCQGEGGLAPQKETGPGEWDLRLPAWNLSRRRAQRGGRESPGTGTMGATPSPVLLRPLVCSHPRAVPPKRLGHRRVGSPIPLIESSASLGNLS